MERKKSNFDKELIAFFIIIYFVGLLGHSFELTLQFMIKLTPYVLLLNALIILFSLKAENKTYYFILFSFVLTLIVEIIGVNTGIFFGDYNYSNILGLKIAGVPIIIGLNWTLIIIGFYCIVENIFNKVYKLKNYKNLISYQDIIVTTIKILLIALFSTLFDYVMEPVAIRLKYWFWQGNSIPFKNYLTWFILSALISFIFYKFNFRIKSKPLQYYILIQFLFFLILNFII